MKEPYIPSEHSLKGLKGAPSEWVKRFIPKLPKGGRVLDLACGCGRNTRLLASCGFEVVGAILMSAAVPTSKQSPGLFLFRLILREVHGLLSRKVLTRFW